MDPARITASIRRQLVPRGLHMDRVSQLLATRTVHFARQANVGIVVDVGAADGGFATRMRRSGWGGRIESFEPRKHAYDVLRTKAARDPSWSAHHVALGASQGVKPIHVTRNGVSSSFRQTSDAHISAAPGSEPTDIEHVDLARLDDFNLVPDGERAFLKLDVQGTEEAVLSGAQDTLDRTTMIQIELSLVELYRGQALFEDMLKQLQEKGFELWWIERGTRDPTSGRLLQMDGILVKPDSSTE